MSENQGLTEVSFEESTEVKSEEKENLFKKLAKKADDLGLNAENISKVSSTAGEYAVKAGKQTATKAGEAASSLSESVQTISEKTVELTNKTVDNVNVSLENYKVKNEINRIVTSVKAEQRRDEIIDNIEYDIARTLLDRLGKSPLEIDDKISSKVKRIFPIPIEQELLWIDAEFDLKPSGIALTNKGVFIRSNVSFKEAVLPGQDDEVKLYFYTWYDFEPNWFTEVSDNNTALLVEYPHAQRFIEGCLDLVIKNENEIDRLLVDYDFTQKKKYSYDKLVYSASMLSLEDADFVRKFSAKNSKTGHGIMVERELHYRDIISGKKAAILGSNNAKNGPDRMVNGIKMQTKFHMTPKRTLESAFDKVTGKYRYYDGNEPILLEVPKDQYDKVVKNMAIKIREGKVPGEKNPNNAAKYIKKASITYNQGKNLSKKNTIDSIKFDAKSGAVVALSTFGISFLVSSYLSVRSGEKIEEELLNNAVTGVKVSSLAYLQHITLNQLSRSKFQNIFVNPANKFVTKIGHKYSARIVNGTRKLAGKSPISGSAASKSLAKVIRSNAVVTAGTVAVMSVPETYKLVSNKISGSQYSRNITLLSTNILGSAGGALVAASLIPNPSQPVAIAAGLVGGMVGSTVVTGATKYSLDNLIEDDITILKRMLNMFIMQLSNEYMLSEEEVDLVMLKMSEINDKEFQKLSESVRKSTEQEVTVRSFLELLFNKTIVHRKH